MGEAPIRGNVSHGDGVYKSTDAGKSWKNVGLSNTRQISTVRVHPKNPDLVYVAAQGHVWGSNEERGIYRSEDGGKSWKKVLGVDSRTGASDLSMDPTNPRILFAGFWQVERKPWALLSGGTGSGLYRSTDAGDTWKKLAGGLPEGVVGKIGVAVSPVRSERVYALVEAEKGGVYRSDDGGEKWTRVNQENKLRQRAWYYTEIYADPKAVDTVYVLNVGFSKSVDGGKSWTGVRTPHGDNHDLWIDPDDPDRMIEGNDGGAAITYNGGRTWSSVQNQPTAQIYRVTTDDRYPYWVYGAQQDNTTIATPSRTRDRGIGQTDWHQVGGCESGWIAPNLRDPDVVYAGCYGGSITRYDHRTREEREILAWPQLAVGQAPKDLKYRFQWNAPILLSPHDPKVLYHAAQKLLRSTDEGFSWTEISADLTRNDPSKQESSGGPITKDNTGVEVYGTIFALAESAQEAGTIWAGSDDGLVQLTRDGGKSWQNVTSKLWPEWVQINSIELSPHDKATAYVAATMYKHDDFRPYLFKTNDYGKTWTKITNGIPDGAFTRSIREDPVKRGLLYAGTETGIHVSFDDGASWQPFQRNLPVVPVTDLAVKDDDLVVATQGRAFWILDDLSALREWSEPIGRKALHLFAARPAVRFGDGGDGGDGSAPKGIGQNPPGGAVVYYWLKDKPDEKEILTIEVLDRAGKVLRTFTSEKKDKDKEPEKDGADEDAEKPLEPKAGLNRFVWDLRMLRPTLVPKAIIWGSKRGPRVAPGTYQVRVKIGETTKVESTTALEVRANPAVGASPADLAKQAELLAAIRDRLSETHEAVLTIRDVKAQVKELASRAVKLGKGEALKAPAKALDEKLSAVEEKLVNPKIKASQDVLNFQPRLDHELVGLASAASSADAVPTKAELRYYDETVAKLRGIQEELKTVLDRDLAAFNDLVRNQGIPPVAATPRGEKK